MKAAYLVCPACGDGGVFQDAAGGYECSACDQRFLIQREVVWGYAGPHRQGRLSWGEKLRSILARLIEPKPRDTLPPAAAFDDEGPWQGDHETPDETPTRVAAAPK